MSGRVDPIKVMAPCPSCGSKRFFDHEDGSYTCANKACRREFFV